MLRLAGFPAYGVRTGSAAQARGRREQAVTSRYAETGPHYCVGAPLARIEARAALTALFAACPGIRLDPDSPPSFYYGARGFVQHGTDALPALLGP
jgi:cytochrome P450